MRIAYLLSVISFLSLSCGENNQPVMEHKILEVQLEETKNLFLQRLNGDPKSHWPGYDQMQTLDAEIENLITNLGTINDINSITQQLEVCDDAAMSFNWYSDEMQNQVHEELLYLLDNIGNFDASSLKRRLQFLQLTYWSFFSNMNARYQYSVDTVGTYPVEREGRTGQPFSTPIAAIAYYTADNYQVFIGDTFINGTLVGNKRQIIKHEEHMPLYVDSLPSRGMHTVPHN